MAYIQSRGTLFELICKRFLELSNYTLVDSSLNPPYKVINKNGSIAVKGRGEWHQIDLPFMYNYDIVLINPIRVLGEVKYYAGNKKVGLPQMRNFSMACLDIYQNYSVAKSNIRNNIHRTLDQAIYISASGFSSEAENFAYSHNVKLIDASKNSVLMPTLAHIDNLAKEIDEQTGSTSERNKILSDLDFLIRKYNPITNIEEFQEKFSLIVKKYKCLDGDKLLSIVEHISLTFNNDVKSTILASGPYGNVFLFISNDEFPYDLFKDSDETKVRLYYQFETMEAEDVVLNDIKLVLRDGTEYEGTVPDSIKDILQSNHTHSKSNIQTKEHFLSPLTFIKKINGKNRILKMKFDINYFSKPEEDLIFKDLKGEK